MYPTGCPVFPILSRSPVRMQCALRTRPCGNLRTTQTPPGCMHMSRAPSHSCLRPPHAGTSFRYQKVISRSPMLLSECMAPLRSIIFKSFIKERTDQPCLCLCLGFSQMILMEPFLLMTLHFSQIGFTDALTFILTSISTFSRSREPARILIRMRFWAHSDLPPSKKTVTYYSMAFSILQQFLFISPDNSAFGKIVRR